MPKRSRSPRQELFSVETAEGLGADVMIELSDDAAEPAPLAPVVDLHLAEIAPATGDIGAAEQSSVTWRLELIPQLEQKLADAKDRLVQSENVLGIAELSLALGQDGAQEQLAELRERQRIIEIERDGLLRAIKRAEAEMAAAGRREGAVAAEQRVARAEDLVKDRVSRICAAIDARLQELGALADDLASSTIRLQAYHDITRVHNRLLTLSSHAEAAVWYAGENLGRLLGLRQFQPLTKMRPLAEQEAALWRLFCPVDVPAAPVRGRRRTPSAVALAVAAEPTGDIRPEPTFHGDDAPPADSATPLSEQLGAGGATVQRAFTGAGVAYHEGDIISGEIVMTWPRRNRAVLENAGYLEYLPAPDVEPAGADTATGAAADDDPASLME